MFDDKKAKTKKRSGFFGDYEEHYDDKGNKIGKTKARSGFFGDYEEHYDNKGNKIGKTQKRSGFFGDYEEHYDDKGNKIGETKKRSGFFGDYEEHSNKKDKSGCFLTTACTCYHGFTDNCYQLEVLRNFRDNYLCSFELGRQDIMAYYTYAPDLVKKINELSEENQTKIYTYILGCINVCVALIENDEKEECHHKYKEMFYQIKQKFMPC